MKKNVPERNRKYTDIEHNEGLLGRRMRAFAERSREPGDGATWAVVLGSFMWTLLIICFSVASQPLLALVTFGFSLVWIIIMARFGRVNVASILWGSATTDLEKPPVDAVVFQSTLAVALISLVSVVIDAVRGWNFGWYGFALVVTVSVYIIVYIRTWIQPAR